MGLNMSLSCTVNDRYSVEYWRYLEIGPFKVIENGDDR